MDKNAIKKFAVWARTELIARVMQKALIYGIEEKRIAPANAVVVDGKPLTAAQQTQRNALIYEINQKGYQHVMEDVAYTWFNRFIALRFMEVNGYLPTRVRVFSDENGKFNPQIIDEAIHLDLDGLDMEKVYAYKEANQTGALYRYLLTTQCNALSKLLPRMFQPIQDYTELLLPDNLLREGSVIEQMVTLIPEEDWQDQVQIIGWLYQYYVQEINEQVYDGNMSKSRIPKELISSATTIYTPDWPVRYMVENSLGRLWLEGHPNETLKAEWKYYLDEAEQAPSVQAQLAKIRTGYADIKPEDIRVIDPCMGSGHILVYMFDVLVQIYEDYGYTTREAVESIIKHNLYGLDIDARAAQLAYFAVMMKARQHDRRFLSRKNEDDTPNIPQPHVYAIEESNGIDRNVIKQLGAGMPGIEYNNAVTQMNALLDVLHDAKEYGSILTVEELDWALLRRFVTAGASDAQVSMDTLGLEEALMRLPSLIDVGEALGSKYDVVVTNPPYLGSGRFNPVLDAYVKQFFPDEKSDLSMVMYRHSIDAFVKPNGFVSFITTSSWMYLASYEKLRKYVAKNCCFSSLVDFGTELFDGKVGHNPIVAWVTRNTAISHILKAVRLVDFCYARRDEKEAEFFNRVNHYQAQQKNFSKIPGTPVAYWVRQSTYSIFDTPCIEPYFDVKAGMCTGDNNRFIVFWHEVDIAKSSLLSSDYLYTPHNKGGEYRKWYGNREVFLKYSESSLRAMELNAGFRHDGKEYYFKPHIGWSKITSGKSSFRYFEHGFTFDSAGLGLFTEQANTYATLALLNSKVAEHLLAILNPTLNVTPMIVKRLPYADIDVEDSVEKCIHLSRTDWDSFETSWDFQQHPLVRWISTPDATSLGAAMMHFYGYHPEVSCRLELAWLLWQGECEKRFKKLKANEEELNRIFIDNYGLQDELTPDVDEKDVTVRRADLGRDIRSLISYAVGVMFGRYSLNKPGLVLAGQPYSDKFVYSDIPYAGTSGCSEQECYLRDGEQLTKCYYAPDRDNVLPICDDEYFEDDIVGKFVKFIEFVYGEEDLEANLAFIANALGGKGTPREVIRSYFLNDFYKDHLKIYQKRPIYWLFDSGKKNGFKCLIYMHRYAPDTIARIRTDYVHEQQSRYRTALSTLDGQIAGASGSERVRLTKQQQKLQAQAEEIRLYEEKIHHLADQMISIDLDDGVKHNYEIFKAVLAPIK